MQSRHLAQGGTVAAPVFASVMSGALRLMDVPPDDLQNVPAADAGAGERAHEQRSVSLMWLLDGIAAVPANDARISDLALDSRDVRAGSLFFALRGRQVHGARIRGRGGRARRERGAVGARARSRSAAPSRRRCSRRRSPILHKARGPHRRPLLQLALLAAAHRRHHRHQRQDHVRLPAGAVPRAPRVGRGLHGHDRLGPHRRARDCDPHDARCRQCAPHARASALARACAMSRWRSPRMPWIRAGWTACASTRPRSPT